MEKKRIKIKYSGVIHELGNILGPILNPYNETIENIGKLVTGGKKVFEVNPDKDGDEILLTIKNYKQDNFKKEDALVEKKEEAAKTDNVDSKETFTPKETFKVENAEAAKTETVKPQVQNVVNTTDTTKKTETVEKSDFTKK